MTLTPETEETIYVCLLEKFLMDGYIPEKYVEDTAEDILDMIISILKTYETN